MKIDVLATHGSPLGVTSRSIYGEDGRLGVGGAEMALLTMCEGWAKAGHSVTLFNNPKEGNVLFQQSPVNSFRGKDDRDILVIFRTPSQLVYGAKGKKVWWSCDQYTIEDFAVFGNRVDKIVCISPHHQKYFSTNYNLHDTVSIDLPVRVEDYNLQVERVKYKLLFASVPDRGLQVLYQCLPSLVNQIPEITVTITSDYRLWGCASPLNESHRLSFVGNPRVSFLGAVKRDKLVLEQMSSDVLAYPCTYEELFCYSVAEACVAGAVPITSTCGAVPTTSLGICIDGDAHSSAWRREWVQAVCETLTGTRKFNREDMIIKAKERFAIDRILKEWDEKVFK